MRWDPRDPGTGLSGTSLSRAGLPGPRRHGTLAAAMGLKPAFLVPLALLCTPGIAASANLVVNPSFEQDSVTPGLFLQQTPAGWTAVGGGTDVLSAGYSGGTAAAGAQFVDLIGNLSGGPFPTGLEQTLGLSAGVTYQLSFAYTDDGGGVAPLDFSLGTLVSGSVDPTGLNAFTDFGATTPWQVFTAEFTPSVSGDVALRFTTASGSFGGPYLDAVSVSEVPEAGSLLPLAGLVGTAWLWRRRRAGRTRASADATRC